MPMLQRLHHGRRLHSSPSLLLSTSIATDQSEIWINLHICWYRASHLRVGWRYVRFQRCMLRTWTDCNLQHGVKAFMEWRLFSDLLSLCCTKTVTAESYASESSHRILAGCWMKNKVDWLKHRKKCECEDVCVCVCVFAVKKLLWRF